MENKVQSIITVRGVLLFVHLLSEDQRNVKKKGNKNTDVYNQQYGKVNEGQQVNIPRRFLTRQFLPVCFNLIFPVHPFTKHVTFSLFPKWRQLQKKHGRITNAKKMKI